jgi:hypothetical protein
MVARSEQTLHPRREDLPLADLEASWLGSAHGEKMICPTCQGKTKVVMTRKTEDEVWVARFRACYDCNIRFWTYEVPAWEMKKMPAQGGQNAQESEQLGELQS